MESPEKQKGNYGDYTSYMPPQDPADGPERAVPVDAAAEPKISPPPQDTGAPAAQGADSASSSQNPQIKERIDTAINDTAGKLRDAAHRLEQFGRPGSRTEQYTHQVSRQLNRGAEYLESTDVDKLTLQLKDTVRRKPLASVGVAFGIGFILSRILRR